MSGDVAFREPLLPAWLLAWVMVAATFCAQIGLPGLRPWRQAALITVLTILLGAVRRPGRPRVEVASATLRVRNADGDGEASFLNLTHLEWSDDDSIGLRRGDGELFMVTRGEIERRRWIALEQLLRERLGLAWPVGDNPFIRSAA